MKRIDPSSGLVNRFRYEVIWESLLEEFLVLEWIMELSELRCSRVIPAVYDEWNPLHHPPAPALQLYFIYIRLVNIIYPFLRFLLQLCNASNAFLPLAVCASPYGKRRSPEPVPSESQFPNLPSLICSGNQFILLLFATSCFLNLLVAMNHDINA